MKMKQLTISLLIFSINICCCQADKTQTLSSVTYTAMTRGSSYECIINRETVSIESNRGAGQNKTGNVDSDKWETLREVVSGISLNQIKSFKSSSTSSAVDRAPTTTLIIEVNGEVYESEFFDEGNPPKELMPLVDMILALAETVE